MESRSTADRKVARKRSAPGRLHRRILAGVRDALEAALDWFPGNAGNRTVLVGFSGGVDSTALLHLLAGCGGSRDTGGMRLLAAHLDHRLRPDSPEQAAFARTAAASLGIEYVGAQRDVAARARREGRSLEEAGRLARLDFFAEIAREREVSAVLLGHTLTDQAETVLLQLARGAGGLGLGAMPPVREDERGFVIVRPLLTVSRGDVSRLVEEEGWPCYRDPTNAQDAFARNRVRHRVLPLLRESVNPRAEAALGRAASLLREDEQLLSEITTRQFAAIAEVTVRGSTAEVRFPAAELAAAHPALGRRLVREGLRIVRGHLRRIGVVHVEAVLRLARAGRGGSSLDLPGATVRLERRLLRIVPPGMEATEASTPPDPAPARPAAPDRDEDPEAARTPGSGRNL